MRVEVLSQKGDILGIKLLDELDTQEFEKNAHNGRFFAYLEPLIKGTTTDQQRKHWYALIKDISDYTGDNKALIIMKMKYYFMMQEDYPKEPSLARNKMKIEDTNKLLQLVIDYCIENDIPLRNNYSDLMTDKQHFAMTMKRICWVCNKPNGEIAHYESVGMGRSRDKIDHTKHKFMCLCRQHHNEQHQIGMDTFLSKYKLVPINLSKENIKELGL